MQYVKLRELTALEIKADEEQYVNESLKRAYEGSYQAGWSLWVANDSYANIPMEHNNSGTEPPLDSTYNSPWLGKSVEDCAKWLQDTPQETALNKNHFTVLNEYSKADDTVLVCRISIDPEFKVDYFPQPTDDISLEMYTNSGLKFDEKAANYQATMETQGKPDRSRAGPYR